MSSTIWTTHAVASEAAVAAAELWRAVDVQHVVSTLDLVDTTAEQRVLDRLVEESKPPLPADIVQYELHGWLSTPFRSAPAPGGSRFRGPADPGVFYGSENVRTACAELGFARWQHLSDSPALLAMPARSQVLFKVAFAGKAVDLRSPALAAEAANWTSKSDYTQCQAFAATARAAGIEFLRYESARDSRRGSNGVVLDARALVSRTPLETQTWLLSVTRERVVWQRSDSIEREVLEFSTAGWA